MRCLLICVVLVPLVGGCGSNFAKGTGSLLTIRSEWIIGEAAMSHQVGSNSPFNRGQGPANSVASSSIVEPHNTIASRPKEDWEYIGTVALKP